MSQELIRKLTNLLTKNVKDNIRVTNNTLMINNIPVKNVSKQSRLKNSNLKFR